MREVEVAYRFGDVPRLFRIEFSRFSLSDGAEAAVTSANITAEHERRGAIGPALENIWTAGFLADGVKIQAFD